MLTEQTIATALDVDASFVDNLEVSKRYVSFDLNGVSYFAKLARGKFVVDNMRRSVA